MPCGRDDHLRGSSHVDQPARLLLSIPSRVSCKNNITTHLPRSSRFSSWLFRAFLCVGMLAAVRVQTHALPITWTIDAHSLHILNALASPANALSINRHSTYFIFGVILSSVTALISLYVCSSVAPVHRAVSTP